MSTDFKTQKDSALPGGWKDPLGRYRGKDNDGKPRVEYLQKLMAMSDEELRAECESKIWLSAYAANNPRSDYHWHVNACYDECQRRHKEDIYKRAYKLIERECQIG